MSDALEDAVESLLIADEATFASLPLLLAHCIFLALPVDARGRACCVCRAWRDALADPSLWTRLDVNTRRSVDDLDCECPRFVSVLRGAAGRARGELCLLYLSQQHFTLDVLLPVLTANAGSLRELRLGKDAGYSTVSTRTVKAVVAAAPQLQVVTAEDVSCTWEDAPRMLRAEPPFAPLQLRRLCVLVSGGISRVSAMDRIAPLAAALADVTPQPALSHLCILQADTAQPAVLGALVDAALARRLPELSLRNCTPPAAAPLARLLAEGSLAVLKINFAASRATVPLFDAAGAALVAAALRLNTTLTTLDLDHARLCRDMSAAGTLLGALTGHPSLRKIRFHEVDAAAEDRIAFGAALAALIAADAPALHVLDCSNNNLKDAGLAPIVEALPLNRHLREMVCYFNKMSEAFARKRLLPAVHANTTLRELSCVDVETGPAAAEAEELVYRRAQQG